MLSTSPPLPARLRVITIILFIVITTMKMGFLLIDFRSLTNCLPFTYLVMIPSLYCGRYLQNSNLIIVRFKYLQFLCLASHRLPTLFDAAPATQLRSCHHLLEKIEPQPLGALYVLQKNFYIKIFTKCFFSNFNKSIPPLMFSARTFSKTPQGFILKKKAFFYDVVDDRWCVLLDDHRGLSTLQANPPAKWHPISASDSFPRCPL